LNLITLMFINALITPTCAQTQPSNSTTPKQRKKFQT
jgi:hypothetical protein